MKKWLVRFVSLLVFNIAVLLVIGFLTSARVGWAALWGGIVMTIAVLFVKPAVNWGFQKLAGRSAAGRSKLREAVVQLLIVLVLAFVVWIVTVVFSGVRTGGPLSFIVPPIIIAIGWGIYALIDDRVEARAGAVYDRATGKPAAVGATTAAPPIASNPATESGRRELRDGLTEEQRRMLDGL